MEMKYFITKEFDSPDELGTGSKMDANLLKRLTDARYLAKIPFVINSGYRTEAHNKEVGGSPTSSHLKGWAVDISCHNSSQREKIVRALLYVGFERIGIAKTFIHADTDKSKSPAIWLY
jgi:uncharacterized protein YcbK (DUF882 family)